jgi:hypothetical protein
MSEVKVALANSSRTLAGHCLKPFQAPASSEYSALYQHPGVVLESELRCRLSAPLSHYTRDMGTIDSRLA